MNSSKQPSGMLGFSIVWIGQAVSLLGTSMTAFALTIWAFKLTGSATALALVGFFHVFPMLLISPLAGAIVDRSNRKLMMMVSDLASGTVTIALLILYTAGGLQMWHLYAGSIITGIFQTFQWPAYSAAITLIVPKKHYARAHAMNELAGSSSGIFAPLLAGALLPFIGMAGIFIIDIVTFVFAILALLVVHIPQPKATEEGKEGQGSLWKESIYGFRYIFARPSLLGLQIVFLLGNFFINIGYTVFPAMILARTTNNALMFGTVETAGAVGGLLGGLLISAWGGPKRRVHGVLGGWAISSVLGGVVVGLGRSLPAWMVGAFFGTFFVPLINSSNQAIWQAKVAPDVQGRVFAIRRLIAWFVSPLAMAIAGPMADFVLEPAMQGNTALAETFGGWFGTGPGAGMSLLIVFGSLCAMCVGLGGYAVPVIRYAEDILPDHKAEVLEPDNRSARLQELLETRQRLIVEERSPEQERALKEISQELRELGHQSLPAD